MSGCNQAPRVRYVVGILIASMYVHACIACIVFGIQFHYDLTIPQPMNADLYLWTPSVQLGWHPCMKSNDPQCMTML